MSTSALQNQHDIYEIRVKGHLDSRRICAIVDLVAAHCSNGETVLTGPIPDQAALYGLLNRLRDLGIPLLSVNRLEEKAHAK